MFSIICFTSINNTITSSEKARKEYPACKKIKNEGKTLSEIRVAPFKTFWLAFVVILSNVRACVHVCVCVCVCVWERGFRGAIFCFCLFALRLLPGIIFERKDETYSHYLKSLCYCTHGHHMYNKHFFYFLFFSVCRCVNRVYLKMNMSKSPSQRIWRVWTPINEPRLAISDNVAILKRLNSDKPLQPALRLQT